MNFRLSVVALSNSILWIFGGVGALLVMFTCNKWWTVLSAIAIIQYIAVIIWFCIDGEGKARK